MSTRTLAHFSLPQSEVSAAADQLQSSGLPADTFVLRSIGEGAVCAVTGATHSVMLLIGCLATRGQAGLLTVETF